MDSSQKSSYRDSALNGPSADRDVAPFAYKLAAYFAGSAVVRPLLGIAVVLLVCELISRFEILPSTYFPPISVIVAALFVEAGNIGFWDGLWNTLKGWALGLAVGTILALIFGILFGSSPFLLRSFRLIIEVLRPIPAVALIPLAVLIFGIDGTTKVVLVAYSVFWPMLFQIIYGIRDVDVVARDTVLSYRLGFWTRIRYLLLPSAAPYFMTGLRISASIALIVSVATELVIGAPGFGAMINAAQASGAHAVEYAYIVATGLLGWFLSVAFRKLDRYVLSWHQSHREVL